MSALVNLYFRLLKLALVCCLGLMAALVFGNVVLRYGFNSGITVSEELSRMLFVWMTFLGAAVGLREHAHLGVDTLIRRLPPTGRRGALTAGHVIMLAITLLMIKGSWAQMVINLTVLTPVTGLPMGLFYAAGVVFGVTSAGVLLAELHGLVTDRLRGDDLTMTAESEGLVEAHDLHLERMGTAPAPLNSPLNSKP